MFPIFVAVVLCIGPVMVNMWQYTKSTMICLLLSSIFLGFRLGITMSLPRVGCILLSFAFAVFVVVANICMLLLEYATICTLFNWIVLSCQLSYGVSLMCFSVVTASNKSVNVPTFTWSSGTKTNTKNTKLFWWLIFVMVVSCVGLAVLCLWQLTDSARICLLFCSLLLGFLVRFIHLLRLRDCFLLGFFFALFVVYVNTLLSECTHVCTLFNWSLSCFEVLYGASLISWKCATYVFPQSLTEIDAKTTDEFVHQDSRERFICVDFIYGRCHKGSSCDMHHSRKLYQWQYMHRHSNIWSSFSEKENESIEKSYCDVGSTQYSLFLESHLSDTRGFCTAILNIDFQTMKCQSPELAIRVRRLSTKSEVTCVSVATATKWVWYWEDDHHVFQKYGSGDQGFMQKEIESKFLERLDSYSFTVAKHCYKLFFYHEKTSCMYQQNQNPQYNTVRVARRRPVFQCNTDVQQRIKEARKESRMGKQENARNTMPSSWSEIPQGREFIRIKLSPGLQEFKEVEKLFRRTVSFEQATITGIERVQNEFMWKRYQSKKDHMRKRRTVEERDLFHGTTHEVVDGICEKNFDWRLCGKNGTKYGEGSYFARDAAYSLNYTSKSSSGSRFMFVAKVLVGWYTEGNKDLRKPPPTFDSCVDDVENPSIFVVFDNDQYYPSHLIECVK